MHYLEPVQHISTNNRQPKVEATDLGGYVRVYHEKSTNNWQMQPTDSLRDDLLPQKLPPNSAVNTVLQSGLKPAEMWAGLKHRYRIGTTLVQKR